LVVGLVIVSHSALLAAGVGELVAQLAPDVPLRAVGGLPDGSLGTSADTIQRAITDLANADGVLILLDLGSAVMSTEIALDGLSRELRSRVVVSDAPLVEGAVLAAVQASLDLPLVEVAAAAEDGRRFPKGTPNGSDADGTAV
jgi:dihydroxyacetone kinase phosphotransfer subunit